MSDDYKQIGGAAYGDSFWSSFNLTFPFASLTISQSQLELNAFYYMLVFPREAITRLSRYDAIFSSGLRIEHTIERYPSYVIFWALYYGGIKKRLLEFGYPVED